MSVVEAFGRVVVDQLRLIRLVGVKPDSVLKKK